MGYGAKDENKYKSKKNNKNKSGNKNERAEAAR
jgi:hypothetical protein